MLRTYFILVTAPIKSISWTNPPRCEYVFVLVKRTLRCSRCFKIFAFERNLSLASFKLHVNCRYAKGACNSMRLIKRLPVTCSRWKLPLWRSMCRIWKRAGLTWRRHWGQTLLRKSRGKKEQHQLDAFTTGIQSLKVRSSVFIVSHSLLRELFAFYGFSSWKLWWIQLLPWNELMLISIKLKFLFCNKIHIIL